MEATLVSDRVNSLFRSCLFVAGEDSSRAVVIEGITFSVRLHPGRLEQHRAEIEALLNELPDKFKDKESGGWSFTHACLDRHGNRWAQEQLTPEQLIILGMALGEAAYDVPREFWDVMPNGTPYFIIDTSGNAQLVPFK